MIKCAIVVGARPNFVKAAPLISEMKRRSEIFSPVLIHTGQHYDALMSKTFFDELGLENPDYNLGIGSGSHATQTAKAMLELEPLLIKLLPDLVITLGDVNSTLAAALVASKLLIPTAHVEAGLRSGDRTMPEEINRIATDSISDLLFATSEDAVENLCNEGIPREKIFLVGNVMIDTMLQHLVRAKERKTFARFGLEEFGYAVATIHRPSNVDNRQRLNEVISLLGEIAAGVKIIFPAHPRTQAMIEKEAIRIPENVEIINPLGYTDFLGLMAYSRFVLTDSGGIQEETSVLGIPCLTIRDNTERPITVKLGTNRVVGKDHQKVLSAVKEILQSCHPPFQMKEIPFWDGRASERICNVIEDWTSRRFSAN
jgi:UDP-N-acetylglucosamine 2-epimerase (non-hydrolysing)